MFEGDIPVWAFYAGAGYFVLFMVAVGGVFLWHLWRRNERPPEKFKLLRGPGETLRRRVQKADETLFEYTWAGAFVPLILGWGVLLVAIHLPKPLVLPGALAAVLVFAGTAVATGIWLLGRFHRRRNDFLGYLGERLVAEHLASLVPQGYRVFHDVPSEGREKDFNLDHVVVGPTGVTVVETKTRRKKKAREGREEHVVAYDGKRLIWPWGEESFGLDQVEAEVDWLRKWIEKRTGLRVIPKPILAIPGWYVKERAAGAVRVANQKMLPSIIAQWRPQPLTPEQIDLISRQLDDRCRDVED